MRFHVAFAAIVLVGGCTSTGRIDQFKSFADLGHRNQVVLAKVIDQAVASNIDANSQEILDLRDVSVTSKAWPAEQSGDAILDDNNQAVIATTRQYAAVKRHAGLLDEYFQQLGVLATYDSAPVASSASSTVESIQQLSPTLQKLKVGGGGLPDAANALVPVIIRGIQGKLLEEQLRAHGDVINRELELQERVLTFIAARIAADQELLSQRKILDKLAVPFDDLTKPAVPVEWVANRRDILLAQAVAAEPAAEAAKLSRQLRQAYLQLLEGKLTVEDVATMSSDLSRLLLFADVTAQSGGRNK